jgi:hypothetical protein
MTRPKPGESKGEEVGSDDTLRLLIMIEAEIQAQIIENKRAYERKTELINEIRNYRQKYDKYHVKRNRDTQK